MKIFSETGYLIIMDPAYLEAADSDAISKIDFLNGPEDAAVKLDQILFPDAYGGLIGLIQLSQGAGLYQVDLSQVSYWDVETTGNKSIFGVDSGSFIIFDIKYIPRLVQQFDSLQFNKCAKKVEYFAQLGKKCSGRDDILIWSPSPLPFAEGWHEINTIAFQKIH